MKNFIDAVKEGYSHFIKEDQHIWIDGSGLLHHNVDHHQVASDEFGNDEYSDEEDEDHRFTSAIRSAFDNGWIRVLISDHEFVADMSFHAPHTARRSLQRLIRDNGHFENYRIGDQYFTINREAIRAASTAFIDM